jgi:hypothetical protein
VTLARPIDGACRECGQPISRTESGGWCHWDTITYPGHLALPQGDGVWVAYNYDGSAFVPFADEVSALRYASGYYMPVKFVEFGDPDWMRK